MHLLMWFSGGKCFQFGVWVEGQRSPSLSVSVCWALPAVSLWPCPAPSSSPQPFGPAQQNSRKTTKTINFYSDTSSVCMSFCLMKFQISLTISEWKAICLARPTLSQIWNTWRRQTGQTEQTDCYTVRPADEHTDDLLSIVVGLKDVADGPAVTSPACRMQDETKQPLVVLMRRTLNHNGERKLQEERWGQGKDGRDDKSLQTRETRRIYTDKHRSSYPEAGDLCLRVNEPEREIFIWYHRLSHNDKFKNIY